MVNRSGLTVNYLGPMRCEARLADGTPVTLVQQSDYPVRSEVRLKLGLKAAKRFTLAVRIPAWSRHTEATLNGQSLRGLRPGRYLKIDRLWQPEDSITLRLDMALRYQAGDLEQYGKVSLYRGPILLAWDSRFNEGSPPPIDVSALSEARLVASDKLPAGLYRPWLAVDVPVERSGARGERFVRFVDFASAGASTIEGKPMSHYTSWLPARHIKPPRPVAWLPADRAVLPPGPICFVWRRPADPALRTRKHTVVIADSPQFDRPIIRWGSATGGWLMLPAEEVKRLEPHKTYWWKVIARNPYGQSESIRPYKRFTIDPAATAPPGCGPYRQRASDATVTEAALHGDVRPQYGVLLLARGWKPTAGPNGQRNGAVELDGRSGIVKYALQVFPERDYTASIWLCVLKYPQTRYGQIFSAWSAGVDDPLRLVIERGKLYARIEAGRFYSTEGYPIELGRWYHVAAVKRAGQLSLYVDGRLVAKAEVPASVTSAASSFAIGGNPNFAGPEFLAARFSDLKLYARALGSEEIASLSRQHNASR